MTTNDANQTSLLAYLAYKFGGAETTATETLRYILSRSEAARNALRDTIRNGGVDVGPIARVQTEVVGAKMERVDLSAYNDAGEERVLIEAKFWAGLTGNQPAAYLERLPNDGEPAVLLFVAPEMRMGTLWPHLQGRAKDEGFTVSDGPETGNLRTAAVDGSNRFLMLTSWGAMLDDMADRAGKDGDPSAERDIRLLNVLCKQQDSTEFLPIKATELGSEFPHRMLNLQRLVDGATKRLEESGQADTEGLKVAQPKDYGYGYGKNLRLGSKAKSVWARAWLGVDYPRWRDREGCPLWLNFDSKDMAIRDVQAKIGYRHIPIILPVGEEYARVLEEAVEQMMWLADRISGEVDDDEWKRSWPGNAQPATP